MSAGTSRDRSDEIARLLVERGFRPVYRSTAVYVFRHAELPGAEVRIGTVSLVAARDEREVYRAALVAVDLDTLLARLGLEKTRLSDERLDDSTNSPSGP